MALAPPPYPLPLIIAIDLELSTVDDDATKEEATGTTQAGVESDSADLIWIGGFRGSRFVCRWFHTFLAGGLAATWTGFSASQPCFLS